MFKKIVGLLTAVLMVTSIASALPQQSGSVAQTQSFSVGDQSQSGMATVINLVHGRASAFSSQSLGINNVQTASANNNPYWNPCWFNVGSTEAAQSQTGDLKQTAKADGTCGNVSVNALLDAGGLQHQAISSAAKSQSQCLGVAANQELAKSGGRGDAVATNSAELSQTQVGTNRSGSTVETSTIDACQFSAIEGAARSTVTMMNSMIASTTQQQQVH